VQEAVGIDFADILVPIDWECACRIFEKRHLLAQDGRYRSGHVRKEKDPTAIASRKITVSSDEITSAISIIETLGKRLFEGIFDPMP
jgi:hypothetical protein